MSLLRERMARPTHYGPLPGSFQGSVGNPACGDVLTLHVAVDAGVIRDASFESVGSPYQLATASVLCDCVTGESFAAARERGPDCVLKRLPDLPERHRYLARLAVEALQLALDAAEGRAPVPGGEVERRVLLGEDEAAAWVGRRLADGPMTTEQVEAAARRAGVLLPVSTAKTLSNLRAARRVTCTLQVSPRAWCWENAR